jgi:hypothetical protein
VKEEQMIETYLYRVLGFAGCVVLVLNVNKHGWNPISIAIGVSFSALLFSLGVVPERRTLGWDVRYVITAIGVLGLAAHRFMR